MLPAGSVRTKMLSIIQRSTGWRDIALMMSSIAFLLFSPLFLTLYHYVETYQLTTLLSKPHCLRAFRAFLYSGLTDIHLALLARYLPIDVSTLVSSRKHIYTF